ncbi:TetR/AcrR family transcriptional regulator [Traorella massiliensis]|uniref:TetR/AcrR family transcriptional regulator n=1 Tax=Traorella massiliensis TaxID=1903263 RepID=UPI0008F87A8F|nr:TetR/AcrR family transcriptional regulator [Traorella massiliensis]
MNQKKNKHYQQTHQKIKDTLLEIIYEKKKVNIAQICRHAGINRTTFYQHYEDIVELIEDVQSSIFKQLIKTYDNEPEKIEFMSFRSYEIFALHVKENQHFYKLYFEMNTTFPLKDGLEEMWEAIIVPYFHDRGIYDEEVMALRFICYQAGFTITLKKWVDQNCHLKIQEVAQILTECLRM